MRDSKYFFCTPDKKEQSKGTILPFTPYAQRGLNTLQLQ